MLYFYLKTIHVVTAAIIVGVALCSSALLIYAQHNQQTNNMSHAIDRWLRLNALLVFPLLLIQMILGFAVISVQRYSLMMPWVIVTFIGFVLILFAWIAASFNLLRYKNQANSMGFYRNWRNFSLLAMLILLIILFFMANRPG
ncbi:MAG: DUF2269 family protein [Coxiellaceae bacterium]|nr:DUF2269 family protein [Coxiellaceae bacterium]